MGVYSYTCPHDDCEKLDEGIRKCRQCNRLIITNRGVVKRNIFISSEWEE